MTARNISSTQQHPTPLTHGGDKCLAFTQCPCTPSTQPTISTHINTTVPLK